MYSHSGGGLIPIIPILTGDRASSGPLDSTPFLLYRNLRNSYSPGIMPGFTPDFRQFITELSLFSLLYVGIYGIDLRREAANESGSAIKSYQKRI